MSVAYLELLASGVDHLLVQHYFERTRSDTPEREREREREVK
jgi:hypothetical protein